MIMTATNRKMNINWNPNYYEEVLQNVNTLLSTVKGSIPLGRKIGIDSDFIDKPVNLIKGQLQVEIIKVLKMYEPRAIFKALTVSFDDNGNLFLEVKIDVESA